MKDPSKEIYGKSTQKYIQSLTTLSLAMLRCPVKFFENSNL